MRSLDGKDVERREGGGGGGLCAVKKEEEWSWWRVRRWRDGSSDAMEASFVYTPEEYALKGR